MIHVLNRVEDDLKRAADLSLLDMGILFALANHPDGMPMSRVAAIFGVDASVVTYRMRRLESLGFARREADTADRRVNLARITEDGLSSLRPARAAMLRSADERFFAAVPAEHLPALMDVFESLRRAQQGGETGLSEEDPA